MAAYKPPHPSELASLKDQNMEIKLCIEELLKETKISTKKKERLKGFAGDIKSKLLQFPKSTFSSDSEVFNRVKVCYPIDSLTDLTIEAPTKVEIVGGFAIGLEGNLDMAVTIPSQFIHTKDYLKGKYFAKKSFYMSVMADHLQKYFPEIQFGWHHGNKLKPILILQLPAPNAKHLCVILHFVPTENKFKLSRFALWQSNLRPEKTTGVDTTEENDSHFEATPFYNAAIASDVTMKSHLSFLQELFKSSSSVLETIELLKIWLKQRSLLSGVGGISGFIITMYVAFLIKSSKIKPFSNSYQLFRTILLQLSKNHWESTGLSLANEVHDRCHTTDFQDVFPVVFLDPTGYVNLCSDVSLGTLLHLKHEAKMALSTLESYSFEAFSALFIKQIPPLLKFDEVFHVNSLAKVKDEFPTAADITFRNDSGFIHRDQIENVLRQGLKRRCVLLAPILTTTVTWPITSEQPVETDVVSFGLLLNPDTYHETVEKGPSPEEPGAKDFCAFWKEKAELRRFQDGICYAVYFPSQTMHDRREVCSKIAKHLLQQHVKIDPDSVTSIVNQLDFSLQIPDHNNKSFTPLKSYGTGEEQSSVILNVFTYLVKDLNSIRDSLPLSIASVKGISSIFRQSEVFPPMANVSRQYSRVKDGIHYPQLEKPCPWFMPSFTILCTMEASGKWPEEYEAVQHFKTLIFLQMEEFLDGVAGIETRCFKDHLLIMKSGFVFRLELAYSKEITLMKTVVASDGSSKLVETEEAKQLEFTTVQLPKLTSYFESLPKQLSFSGAVRLAKRWLASQMFDDSHIPEIAIDLIVASLYVTPEPYEVPKTPLAGFLRFLQFMSTFDWKVQPLIVNFGKVLSNGTIKLINRRFQDERSALPLMFIGTPVEHEKSWITKNAPIGPVLKRIAAVAHEMYQFLLKSLSSSVSESLGTIFTPSYNVYDVLIQLKKSQIATRHQSLEVKKHYKDYFFTKPNLVEKAERDNTIPLVEYNPVSFFVEELRATYGHAALFFYDKFGGRAIGVIWKPQETNAVVKREEIMADIERIGYGLVLNVITNTQK